MPVPIQITLPDGSRSGSCGEGGLIGKAGRGIGVDQGITREVMDALIIDQVQTQCSKARDSADGHRVHRGTYGGHLHERGRDRSRRH